MNGVNQTLVYAEWQKHFLQMILTNAKLLYINPSDSKTGTSFYSYHSL